MQWSPTTSGALADTTGWAVAGIWARALARPSSPSNTPTATARAVALSSYDDPAAEPGSVTAGNPALRRRTDPLWM